MSMGGAPMPAWGLQKLAPSCQHGAVPVHSALHSVQSVHTRPTVQTEGVVQAIPRTAWLAWPSLHNISMVQFWN